MKDTPEKKILSPLKTLLPIYTTCFLGDGTIGILSIAVPIYANRLGASPLILGLIGAIVGLTYTISAMTVSRVSRKIGRRSTLLIVILLQSIISFAYSLSSNYFFIIMISAFQGIAFGAFWPNMESLLADKIQSNHIDKAITGFNVSWSIGTIIGPFLGGALIEYFSAKAAFYVAAVLPLITWLLVVIVHPKKTVKRNEEEVSKTLSNGLELLNKLAITYMAVFLFAFSFRTIISLFPAFAGSLNISPLETGSIILFLGLARTILFTQNPMLDRHFERRTIMIIGSGMITLSAIIIATGSTIWYFMLGMIALGLGYGMNYFSAISTILSGDEANRGIRTGLFEGMIGLGGVVGPMLGGILSEIDMRFPYASLALITLLFFTYQLAYRWKQKKI
ncbi:MAG: hypothetical protein QG670_2744 [Thermoproteota archaeon]|nr:hypothetical protein [Thermoproteota archaeon]